MYRVVVGAVAVPRSYSAERMSYRGIKDPNTTRELGALKQQTYAIMHVIDGDVSFCRGVNQSHSYHGLVVKPFRCDCQL